MAFGAFTVLYSHHHCLVSSTFSSPQKKTRTSEAVTPHFLSPQSLASAHLLSVSAFASHRRFIDVESHTMCGLVFLAAFTEQNVFKFLPVLQYMHQ